MKTLFALTMLAVASHAGEVCHTSTYPTATTNWSGTFAVPKHDPTLGALQSVTVSMKGVISGHLGLENLAVYSEAIEAYFASVQYVARPDSSWIVSVRPTLRSTLHLGAFDGTVDFAGTSGQLLTGLQVERETHVRLQSAADLALFTATGSSQTVVLDLAALGASFETGSSGPLAVALSLQAAVDVTVCYGYREITQTNGVSSQTLNWNQSRSFAKHDPALGPLRAVRIRARTTLTGEARVENPSPIATLVNSELACVTSIARPDASTALTVETYFPCLDPLAAFDGAIDFGGTSGASHTGISAESSAGNTLNSPADLALFTATFPDETISLQIASSNTSTAIGPGPLITLLAGAAGCEVDVSYDYSAPITLYCFGDGSSLPCICGPSVLGAQQGCPNSSGLGGELRASGFAEVGADTLVLTTSNLPATTTVILLQGTSQVTASLGDGLQCVGGTTRRLGIRSASAGSGSFPPAGLTISRLGSAATGTTLRYQGWYRDAVPFCTPGAFNLTNGVAIAW